MFFEGYFVKMSFDITVNKVRWERYFRKVE